MTAPTTTTTTTTTTKSPLSLQSHTSRLMQLPEGKRIHMYRSGDTYYKGVSMVVNPMQVKSFDGLLAEATSKVNPAWGAVRSIHTPNTGTVVENLSSLRRHGAYVAAGPKGFVSIPGGYESIGQPGLRRKVLSQTKTIHLRPVEKNDIYNVVIYKNGDGEKAIKYKFLKSDFSNWDEALHKLSDKVRLPSGPVKRIYHLTGKILSNPEEIVNHGRYVAASSNELFRKAMYGDMAKEEKDVGTGYKGSKYYKEHLNTRRNTRASLQGQTGDKRAKSLGRKVLKKKSDHLQKVEEVEGKEETAVKAIAGVEHPWREHEEKEGDMEENGMEAIPEESEHQWREYEEVEKENDEGDVEEKGMEAIPEESEHPWREYEEVEKENDEGDAEEKGVEAIPEESEHPWKEHEEVEKENNEGDMEETAMKAVPVESEHPWREHEVEKENDEGDGEETGMESIPEESEHPWREHKGLENEDEGNVEEKGYEEEDGEDEDGEGARRKKEGPASSSHGRAHTVTSSKVSSRRTKGSTKSSRRNQTRHSKHTSPEDHVETHVSDLEFSVVPYGIPKQIPESDFANVDYYRLRHFSQPNSSQHSPLNTPSHSQPSSPQNHNYSSRGQHGYSFHEAIEEDTGEVIPSLAAVHATRGHSAESGHSVYDSGNASLFSDDDRPDSVFKAKNRHSRPITRAIEVNYDTDDGGVYRSKKRADYSRGALEILDSTDTKIELPVDMIEPVEIQEEVYAT